MRRFKRRCCLHWVDRSRKRSHADANLGSCWDTAAVLLASCERDPLTCWIREVDSMNVRKLVTASSSISSCTRSACCASCAGACSRAARDNILWSNIVWFFDEGLINLLNKVYTPLDRLILTPQVHIAVNYFRSFHRATCVVHCLWQVRGLFCSCHSAVMSSLWENYFCVRCFFSWCTVCWEK